MKANGERKKIEEEESEISKTVKRQRGGGEEISLKGGGQQPAKRGGRSLK